MPALSIPTLLASGPIVTDGAWGTQLQARGLKPGECPDAWNLSHPELVESVAAGYVAAGSRVILSNTFGANRIVLAGHGLAAQAAAINRAGAAISRKAAGTSALVFASIGPSGKLLAADEVTAEELTLAFTEQARALKDGGADAVVIETMTDPGEAEIACAAARAAGLPVVLSFTFDSGKNLDRTMNGLTPEAAAKIANECGADAVGANCGLGITQLTPILRRMRAATTLPLWAKPNAGRPTQIDGKDVYGSDAAAFAAAVPDLVSAGAAFVGGCCGSSPEVIAAIKSRLERT